MTALTWLPTTLIPEVGHIWATDDTTECHRHGTPTSTGQMTGKCVACIEAYGNDAALSHPDVKWLTRGSAPFRHGFREATLTDARARPVCGYQPLATSHLYESDLVIRCSRCVEALRTGQARV